MALSRFWLSIIIVSIVFIFGGMLMDKHYSKISAFYMNLSFNVSRTNKQKCIEASQNGYPVLLEWAKFNSEHNNKNKLLQKILFRIKQLRFF